MLTVSSRANEKACLFERAPGPLRKFSVAHRVNSDIKDHNFKIAKISSCFPESFRKYTLTKEKDSTV